ncbi:hypothetical protein GCM10009122_23240 [Fulvivirga kasyanovii]|uniref:YtxH domain-containing protein n=1 Tax=Fulvivirga kasyanovii TaxID=396812 RepID=A0ABW9S0J7_9BACT|nr:hypothetical protein [Fulvivirga kasyanovii]MTI28970.1 hypothetical protein [Fulvivirga kasyanovii]
MKTVAALAIGFWLGRQLYINYDRQQAIQKEAAVKRRLKNVLGDLGISKAEIEQTIREVTIEKQ